MGLFSRSKPTRSVRDIPTLYPSFYERILTTVGLPVTEHNMVQVIDLVAFGITIGGAQPYFKQVGDSKAARDFETRFWSAYPAHLVFQLPDDMIDWLWEWDARCHEDLRRRIPLIEALLTEPDSWLRTCGEKIPPRHERG